MNYKSAIYTIPQKLSHVLFECMGKGVVPCCRIAGKPWIGWPKRRSIMTSSDNTCLCLLRIQVTSCCFFVAAGHALAVGVGPMERNEDPLVHFLSLLHRPPHHVLHLQSATNLLRKISALMFEPLGFCSRWISKMSANSMDLLRRIATM